MLRKKVCRRCIADYMTRDTINTTQRDIVEVMIVVNRLWNRKQQCHCPFSDVLESIHNEPPPRCPYREAQLYGVYP